MNRNFPSNLCTTPDPVEDKVWNGDQPFEVVGDDGKVYLAYPFQCYAYEPLDDYRYCGWFAGKARKVLNGESNEPIEPHYPNAVRATPLSAMSRDQLRDLAKALNLRGWGKFGAGDLRQFLIQNA
jgi:hypothetical protein